MKYQIIKVIKEVKDSEELAQASLAAANQFLKELAS